MNSTIKRLIFFVWAFVMVGFFFLFKLDVIQQDDVFLITIFLIACGTMMHYGLDHTYDDLYNKKEPPEQ